MLPDPKYAPAGDRARWLSELTDALDQAHALLEGLAGECGERASELDLFNQLAALRSQLHRLRLGRPDEQTPPEWTIPPPWPTDNPKKR